MKKLRLVLDPSNKYRNTLYCGDEYVVSGNGGLESVAIEWDGRKRMSVGLTLTGECIDIAFADSACPELGRYSVVEAALGDLNKVAALHTCCDLLQTSSLACIGCPRRPQRDIGGKPISVHAPRRVDEEAEEKHHGGKT